MEIKNMQYWKRKNALPGIIHEGDKNLPDGRSLSAPLQANTKSGSADAGSSDKNLKPQEVTYSKGKPTPPTRSGDTKFVGDIGKKRSKKETKFIKKISDLKTSKGKDVTKPWTH